MFAFTAIIDKQVDKVCAYLERSNVELTALESQIRELKLLLLLNEGDSQNQIKKPMGSAGFG
jgi:hypothetical protein